MKKLVCLMTVFCLSPIIALTQTAKPKPTAAKSPIKSPAKSAAKTAKTPATAAKPAPPKSVPKPAVKTVPKPAVKSAPPKTPAIKAAAKPAPAKPAAKIPAKLPIKVAAKPEPKTKSAVDQGTTSGKTYTNETFNFTITFPDAWLIPGKDFETLMLKQGIDLRLKPPSGATAREKAEMQKTYDRVNILLTAYRSMPGTDDNAIIRVSVEDLRGLPQIKDAVDYFDSMRQTFKAVKLPPDFKYSETQAERLGAKQFGFLDMSGGSGKKRIYAIVRNGYALLFTLTYTGESDLQTFRQILTDGNFAVR